MKQGNVLNRIVMLVFLAAIVLYMGVYVWNSFTDPYATVPSYAYSIDDSVEGTGFLVRQESVIPGTGAIVDLTRDEGEKVAKGESVAVVYQSTAAAERRQQIRTLEVEREQLNYALAQDGDSGDSAQLSREVTAAIVTLRASVAAGDFTQLEDQAMGLKSLVYKREATHGEAAENRTTVQEAVKGVDDQLKALNAQSAQDTSRVTVSQPGIFSSQVDGYEALLTPALAQTLSPSALDALEAKNPVGDSSAVGKLITSSTWYFVCPLPQEESIRFVEGHSVQVRFSRDWAGEVEMKVERISAPEDGRVTLLLSTSRHLSDTTLLRRQTVDLVFSSKEGIRVPKTALRVSEDGTSGVYALVGVQAEYKQVQVVDQRDDYCIVLPVVPEDERQAKKMLRAGDQIIVASEDLFDGMVVR